MKKILINFDEQNIVRYTPFCIVDGEKKIVEGVIEERASWMDTHDIEVIPSENNMKLTDEEIKKIINAYYERNNEVVL